MAQNKSSSVGVAQLREAFKSDLAACWQAARKLHPEEKPYAFALHGLEGTPHLYPYVLTEEGLSTVAKRYVAEGYHETVDEARKDLRYSMEDSPYAGELEGKLPNVDGLMQPIEDKLDETEGYALLAQAAMAAFISLDKEGVFGEGKQRQQLLLLIDTSLAETDWSKASAKKLNSPAAFRRYELETKAEGVYASSEQLVVSPDGHLLFFLGNRATKPDKDPSISEIVACEVVGLRVKRRWAISSPSKLEEPTPQLACGPDGTLFVLKAKVSGTKCTTLLAQILNGKKAKEVQMPGEPAGFAVSPDGARIVVLGQDKSASVLNDKLEVIGSHKVESQVRALRFLKRGGLWGITNRGFVTMDLNLRIKAASQCKDGSRVSFDGEEKLCAVSGRPKDGLIGDQKPKDQLGIEIFRFPKLELVRRILIPGHIMVRATLSPDGKLVACRANECGKYQSFIAVFETATGREIARKKSDSYEMAFLPGRDVLAITMAGEMKGEPVDLWKFR